MIPLFIHLQESLPSILNNEWKAVEQLLKNKMYGMYGTWVM